MAKGKHSTALFEVMNKGKLPGKGLTASARPEESSASAPVKEDDSPSFLSPRWWFKPRSRTCSRTLAPGQATIPSSMPEPAIHGVMSPESDPAAAPADETVQSELPRPEPVALRVDRDRQQISLKLSYTSAMIGGLGFVVVVAIAILIGRSLSRGPSTAIANASSQQLRNGPVTPGVMNVSRNSTPPAVNTTDTARRTTGSVPNPGTRATQGAFNDVRPPATFFTDDPRRNAGLNYAIIQSYPDKETASKASEFLIKHGIPTTVEQNLPGWRLPWPNGCVVVGTRGFSKVQNNLDLESYKKSILDLGIQFAGSRSRFNAFEPTMYRWQKTN